MQDISNGFNHVTGQFSTISPTPSKIEWFDTLRSGRFFWARLYSALLLTVLYYLIVVFCQTSVFHPFASVLNLFYIIFSGNFWLGAIVIGCSIYFLSWFYISNCFHPFYEKNYNVLKFQVIMAALGMFSTYVLVWLLVMSASLIKVYSSWTTFILFVSTAFFASYQTALDAEFRWQCSKVGLFTMLHGTWRSILTKGVTDLARSAVRGYMMAVVLCVVIPSARLTFFDLLFALSTNISNFFLVFVLQVAAVLIFKIINTIVMQPVNLPLIGQSTDSNMLGRQSQNLINAITSSNSMLKEFGFYALSQIARASPETRKIIFSLSQPGNKPRNWTTVYDLCTRIIETTREMLQASTTVVEPHLGERKSNIARLGLNLRPVNTPTIRPMGRRQFEVEQTGETLLRGSNNGPGIIGTSNGSTENGHSFAGVRLNYPKHRLLQPSSLNPRTQVSTYKPRIFYADLSWIPGYSTFEHFFHLFWSTFLRPTPTVSSYYMKLSEYCLDTLAVLATFSVEEDGYGVVQTHLPDIISAFLRLELAIDLYIRSTSNNKNEQVVRGNLYDMENVLDVSLKRIYLAFQPYIGSLQLEESERKILDTMVSDLKCMV